MDVGADEMIKSNTTCAQKPTERVIRDKVCIPKEEKYQTEFRTGSRRIDTGITLFSTMRLITLLIRLIERDIHTFAFIYTVQYFPSQ